MGGSVGGRTHGKGEGRLCEYHELRRAEGSDFETLRHRRRSIPVTVPSSKKEAGGDFRGGGTARTRLGDQIDKLRGVVQKRICRRRSFSNKCYRLYHQRRRFAIGKRNPKQRRKRETHRIIWHARERLLMRRKFAWRQARGEK